ncbi:hypothetical protein NCS57_01159500 [Fusarium keratoplasticum]|uniref:Uncharacterized protein n=1 Tax=Fusarium keratoplasticum TaxID=1328300 RepID=A0ACC0QKG5_9HYPO|nr:hypothetical protein NCS57_01159500 [Fusarium keratoplasticum]KAI8657802.1 hypothetical protein NCS57_01159500 [Fusarium keratoplasticum]KAI8658762.1 hypothetical protein NCS55_01154000 [Fusarium keratoplasticum]
MATALPPNGPLNLDASLQGPHFQKQETKDSNAPTLYGNDGEIEDARLLTPCSPDTPIEELRRRYWHDGVLWVKGLLDPDLVNDFRAAYLSMMDDGTNMLKPGTNPRDGIFNPDTNWRDFTLPGALRVAAGLPDTGPFVENAIRSHHWSRYQEFKDTIGRRIEPFIGNMLGFEESWCLPRSLLRCAVPGGEITPVHYDQIFLRAGPPTSVTAWVPIGDVEVEGGGLIYLDRAHDIGVKYEEDFSKMNADLSDEERMSAFNKNMEKGGWLDKNASRFGNQWSRAWLVASNLSLALSQHFTNKSQGAYEAGDVVFHTPYTIHAGAKNRSPKGRVRVSTDLRFVDKTKPYDERWTFLAYSENDPNVARKTALRKQA